MFRIWKELQHGNLPTLLNLVVPKLILPQHLSFPHVLVIGDFGQQPLKLRTWGFLCVFDSNACSLLRLPCDGNQGDTQRGLGTTVSAYVVPKLLAGMLGWGQTPTK